MGASNSNFSLDVGKIYFRCLIDSPANTSAPAGPRILNLLIISMMYWVKKEQTETIKNKLMLKIYGKSDK